MPVRFEIDTTRRRVVTTWEGDVTLEESRHFLKTLNAHPDFDPTFDQVSDARRVRTPVESNRMSELAHGQVFRTGSRRAIVVDNDLLFGVSRMYQAYTDTEGPEIRVFRDLDEAHAWLENATAQS